MTMVGTRILAARLLLYSLPPCGGVLGEGGVHHVEGCAPPPPRPSPIKGEGENISRWNSLRSLTA